MAGKLVETPLGWIDSTIVDEFWAVTDLHDAAEEKAIDAWNVMCELAQAGDVGGAALAKEVHAKARAVEARLADQVAEVVERLVYHAVPNLGTEGNE